MRLKMISTLIWALLVSRVVSRPQQTDAEPRTSQVTKYPDEDARSRLEPQNDQGLKDNMDQSLRTVATQLLNVSGPEEATESKHEAIKPKLGLLIRKPDRTIPPAKEPFSTQHTDNMGLVKGPTPDLIQSGRPVNSKYNYFEVSHPGQAMAMTDEDLEREVLATRYPSYKTGQTTTGGLSTWILLNPPSSTAKSTDLDTPEGSSPEASTSQAPPTETITTSKPLIKTTLPMQKLTSQKPTKSPPQKKTSPKPDKTTSSSETVTPRSETVTSRSSISPELSSTVLMTDEDLTTLRSTTKKITPTKNTPKLKSTTARATTILTKTTTIKVVKPPARPSKLPTIRKSTTSKPEVKTFNSTSKIEKVTFKPVQMITTPKSSIDVISKPVFSAKVQGSIKTDPKPSSSLIDASPKPNNVLKLHLKKPVDTATTIQIDPIRVSAPVLTIEKLNNPEELEDDKPSGLEPVTLPNTQIDVKFDFNPELTTVTTSTEATTTKRLKSSSKRKKHKIRRRKPSTASPMTSTSSTVSTTAAELPSQEPEQLQTSSAPSADTSLQESKIVPDSNTKLKKKQVAKPITTQIYNFISREVMPSVGVMSLVGLGLGLASYFLYPFGGAIARRNYEVEPNYKYNLDEYGGNYGQREEEVFTKVLQGMNTNDGKYGNVKDFEKNYYTYQTYDGAYTDTTRRADTKFSTSSVPVYRPEKTPLPYDPKYRNNGFKYTEVSTTPTYYDRPKGSDFVAANIDRRFVVGSIPTEYSSEKKLPVVTSTEATALDFEKQIAQSLHFGQNQDGIQRYNQPNAQALKANQYEDIEIAPAAVAVEHGPRSLRLNESGDSPLEKTQSRDSQVEIGETKKRSKRDSVIQLIPSRSEIEKEEREIEEEEPLSNEIIDIIDSALPEDMIDVKKEKKKGGAGGKKHDVETKKGTTDGQREELTTNSSIQGPTTNESEVDEASTKSPKTTAESESSPTVSVTESGAAESSSIGGDPNAEILPPTTGSPQEGFSVFNFMKRVAEVKFRLGLTILKHASESFARYLGHVQKRINGDE